jgi:UDP-N-acetyl-D-mannosaminuronic acid dehydrogenase
MVNVIGLGYIGLPTALILASSGNDVVGTDKNGELINTLKKGKVTFDENGLAQLYENALRNGIRFSSKYEKAEVYIVAVPTPYEKKTKKIDCKYVVAAVESILKVCDDGAVIIIESTISPGTIDKFIRPLAQESGKKINLAHAPERIIPGNMIFELKHNSRTIGVDDPLTGEKVRDLYKSFCDGEIVLTDIKTAEMSKVVENTFRDVNIAFANELAKICRKANMDVYEIIKIANKHPRVNILSPGPGVGGHCISVDPWFLAGDFPDEAKIIKTAREVNDEMPSYVLGRIKEIMGKNGIKDMSKVGLYGLTYKENVDDTRESPTLQLIGLMKKEGFGDVKVYDPHVKKAVTDNQYNDFDRFLNDINMIVILVGHNQIKNNEEKIKDKIIFDTRNVCKLKKAEKL